MGRVRCANGHTSHHSRKAARACESSGKVFEVKIAVVVKLKVTAKGHEDATRLGLAATDRRCKSGKLKVASKSLVSVTELTYGERPAQATARDAWTQAEGTH